MARLTQTGEVEAAAGPDDDDRPGLIATSTALQQLRPEWLELLRAAGTPGPFQHPDWHATWLRHFGGAHVEPIFLAFRDGERLVGVATLDGADAAGPRELGDPDVRDYAGPVALPGSEEAVADTLLEWLGADFAPGATLWGVREDDAVGAAIARLAPEHGWSVTVAHEADAPVAALSADLETFVAGLGKHDRHELRRKLRNLRAAGEVVYAFVTDPRAVEQELDGLLTMMRASHEGKAAFLSATVEAFFRDVAVTFARLGMAGIGVLSLEGVPIARLLAFVDERGMYLYNSGYDAAHRELSPGLLSKALAIEDAITKGLPAFHFLRGHEDYKHRLGGRPHEVRTLTLLR
jgi:CelD/BcsL family acetyltransferase involved in cellulose biosynthesis